MQSICQYALIYIVSNSEKQELTNIFQDADTVHLLFFICASTTMIMTFLVTKNVHEFSAEKQKCEKLVCN